MASNVIPGGRLAQFKTTGSPSRVVIEDSIILVIPGDSVVGSAIGQRIPGSLSGSRYLGLSRSF